MVDVQSELKPQPNEGRRIIVFEVLWYRSSIQKMGRSWVDQYLSKSNREASGPEEKNGKKRHKLSDSQNWCLEMGVNENID